MKELLATFSLEQILLFIVLSATAIKGAITWFDWVKERVRKGYEGESKKNKTEENMINNIEDLKKSIQEINEKMDDVSAKVKMLMDSDKDDIKAYITREHHYFCYKLGYIDDYNLDCLERRYSHYKEEGGNSFVADLMGEIRALPKKTIDVEPWEVSLAKMEKRERER